MTSPRVLLLGGHGKVSQLLTPMLLSKNWNITSVIRTETQKQTILDLGKAGPGKIDVLVDSLEEIKKPADAQRVIDQVKPDYVVFSAGAGGKGGPERTKAIDEIAAKAYISATTATPSIKKFLLVSYVGCSKDYPSWWSEEDRKQGDAGNAQLANYYKAKLEADEHLLACAHKRNQKDRAFQAIDLRPGRLTDEKGTGKVCLGKTGTGGSVSREDVARVAAALLERDDTRGWYDLLSGEEGIPEAVNRLVEEGWTGLDGQDLERIYARPTEM